MAEFEYPDPALDSRELHLIEKLMGDFTKFTSPGFITKSMQVVRRTAGKIVPEKLQRLAAEAVGTASELDYVKQALEYAQKGFGEVQKKVATWLLLSPESIVKVLRDNGCAVHRFEQICGLRSYRIEPVVTRRSYGDLFAALGEGAATGAPGLPGVPFSIALSFLLYFRAAQSTALYYGYDVVRDPRELEIASAVTLQSLSPTLGREVESLGGYLAKMMMAAELSTLRHGLKRYGFQEMAERGGMELVYVQIRAMANQAAKKALDKAGKQGIEAGVFKNLLEQVGKLIPREVGKKAVPVVGAVIGGFSDAYFMNRVVYGSNLIYHKRFLLEKEVRVKILRDGDA